MSVMTRSLTMLASAAPSFLLGPIIFSIAKFRSPQSELSVATLTLHGIAGLSVATLSIQMSNFFTDVAEPSSGVSTPPQLFDPGPILLAAAALGIGYGVVEYVRQEADT